MGFGTLCSFVGSVMVARSIMHGCGGGPVIRGLGLVSYTTIIFIGVENARELVS